MEKRQSSLLDAVETGQITDSILARLKAVDAELDAARSKRVSLIPEPVELPEDLPALYRAFIEDLAETLTNGEVAGRASDEMHEMIDEVVVSWDADLGNHTLEIRGKLLEMLQKAKPALEAGLVSNESSAKVVAGA